MGCVIKYKGQSISEEQFLQYLSRQIAINNLFNENESLANEVYEALGYETNIIQDNKSYYRGQIEKPTVDKNGNLVLYAKEDELYKRAGLKSKGVSMTDDLQSAIEYGNGQLEVVQNLLEEEYGYDVLGYEFENEIAEIQDNGYYLIQIPKNIPNEIVKEAGEVKVIGDKIVIPKGQYKIEQVIDGVDTQITPQQKQKAQQLYSQYLDVVFEPEQIHILGSKQDIEGFKGFVEGRNNKFNQEANIYLSPEVQDDFSSIWDNIDKEQEEDMIAMGIIKEPSKAGIEKEDNLKPYFETLLNTKLDLIRRIESKLDRLKTEKKRNKNNTEVLKSLNNEIEKYEEILEGSEITKGLKTQYQELKMTPALDKFLMYAEVELSRVDDLMKSERFEDTLEAKVILDFYSRINPEVEIENNTLFAKEDILDSAGNIDLTPETLNKLRDLSTQAIAKQAQIEKVQREKILERINELSKVTEVYQNPLDEQDIFFSDTGLKDVTWFDMMMYDGQHNTFSQGDILRQTAQMLLEEEINKEEFWARDMDNRVKNIKDRLAKRLAKLGIKNSSIFMAKDSGFKTRRLISRETQKYFDKRNIAIYAKLRERNKEIALMEDFRRRQSGRINLAREILDWKRGNEIVLDVNAIEEIQKLFPEFSDYFKDSQGIAEHLQELERNYGNTPQAKRELDKMIKEQINKIQEYKLSHDTFLEDLLKAENVTKIEDLSVRAEIEYINWVNFNSPFVYANDFQTFEVRYQQGNPENTIVPIVPQFKYNSFIPRRYEAEVDIIEKKIIEKTTETGYYDNDFSIIENDEVLLEFYDILRELVDYIYKNIPYEEQKNFNPFEIISVDKTLMETLNDPDVKGLTVVSKFFQWIMDWLKRNITEKPRSIVSNLAKNPITSEEEYKVNADFLKFASKAVQHKSTVEAVRLKQILGLGYNDNLSRVMSTNDITQSALDYYSNLLGETITKQDIKNKFGSEYNPYKFLQKILLHNESQNYSSDLPKIVSYYSKVAAIYAGRQRALPLLTSIKREYEKIKTVRTNPQGIPLENAPSDINANLRTKANIQFSSWFNRAVLGEYSSKNEFGTVKKVRKLRFTSNEKENVKKIDKLLEDLAADRERLIKTPSKKSTQELMAITKIEENLLLAKQNMGSVITGASIMDGIFKFLRFKGLGWNLNGAITNFFEGQIANIIAASKNQSFSEESFWRAIGVIRESNFKNLSFGKFSTKDSRKARIIMDNYDILQDMTNELQKSSNKSVYSGLNRYLPFELIRRIEYMNQTPVALAILMDTQIKNDKGETSSVWDALDEYGKLLPEFATETNKYNWEILSREETLKIEQNNPGIKRNQYNATKYTIIETLVNLHGDYHDLRGMMASEFISGKALLMFKRWWGMQVFSRFAVEQMHLGLGRKVKGRYRSLSAGQLANYGALIGGIFAGPLGAGVGAATLGTIGKFAGIERSTNAQVKSNLYLISEMFLVTKDMILKMLGIPVNAIAGKQLVKTDSKWLNSSGYSEIDIENIKGNIAEMSLLLGMTALMLIVKGLRGYGREDEDDEGLIRETTHNFLVNKIMQLADQTLSYNPYGIVEDLTSADAISAVRFMYDNALLVRDFANMLQGEGTILGGPNKGEERFLIQLRRTYLPSIAKDGFGFGASMERQYLPSPFDDISRSTEKITDREILKLRSKYQNRLESNLTDLGFTEEQVDKKVKEKMKKLHKKKKESKEAQLKRIKKVVDK